VGHGQIMLGGQLLPCWSELISTTAPFRLFFCAPDLDACPKSLTMLLLRCSKCAWRPGSMDCCISAYWVGVVRLVPFQRAFEIGIRSPNWRQLNLNPAIVSSAKLVVILSIGILRGGACSSLRPSSCCQSSFQELCAVGTTPGVCYAESTSNDPGRPPFEEWPLPQSHSVSA
jgi:hypothetical protein